jgi:hypothetical protein
MGHGAYSHDTYTSASRARKASGVSDFEYTKTATEVHKNLDPKRIKDKPFKKLESRDSKEHPESNAVFVSFDVTGSNYLRAVDAQKKLTNLMELLKTFLPDPQVLIAANDDYEVEPEKCVQISDFESDNRVDEHLRNTILVRDGGSNDHESYDLILLAAAKMTVLDCLEKRGRKGYFFMYADEPIKTHVDANEVQNVFGISAEGRLSVSEVIKELKRQYHVYVIWPEGGYAHARAQYEKLFGEECVVSLQHPNLICELIGSLVGLTEKKISEADLEEQLVTVGSSKQEAREVARSVKGLLGTAHRAAAR